MDNIYAPPTPPPPSGNGHSHDGDASRDLARRSPLPWEDPAAHGPSGNGSPGGGPASPPAPGDAPRVQGSERGVLYDVKVRVHRRLLERLNLANLDTMEREPVVAEIRKVLHELLSREVVPLNFDEREELVVQVLDELFGLGPIEPLLKDPEISDILVNTHKQVIVEKQGKLEVTDVRFKDDRHLLQVIDRIVSGVGRRIDDLSAILVRNHFERYRAQ